MASQCKSHLVFKNRALEVVGNVIFVRIQSIRIVKLLIVDVHPSLRKNSVKNVVYLSNEEIWNLSLLFCHLRCSLIRFSFFFVLSFNFFAVVSFVTTTLDSFEFQSQVPLFQINPIYPIRLNFKLDAVFVDGGSGINFLLVGRQDIVIYWDFPS